MASLNGKCSNKRRQKWCANLTVDCVLPVGVCSTQLSYPDQHFSTAHRNEREDTLLSLKGKTLFV